MQKTKKKISPLITTILIIGTLIIVIILIWNSDYFKKAQKTVEEKEEAKETIPVIEEKEETKETITEEKKEGKETTPIIEEKETALAIEEKEELTLSCSKTSLNLKETCWDDERLFLTLENAGDSVIEKLRLIIWGDNKGCMGETFTEEGIGVGESKTYAIDYDKQTIGGINNFEIVRFINYKDKSRGCEPVDKGLNALPNKCTSPLSETIPSENLVVTYAGACDLPEDMPRMEQELLDICC